MGFDRPRDSDDGRPDSSHRPEAHGQGGADDPAPPPSPDLPDRETYWTEYQRAVEAEYRAYAIDKGCDRVRETEEAIVTPAMHRIEGEDPERHLIGLEFRLKGKERLAEKITKIIDERGRTTEEAFGMVKDAIRYTFQYTDERYADGVLADCARLKAAGFQLVDRENSWDEEQYKGINSRWRVPENGQLFEVQFHTQSSFEAKQLTHSAYEKLRVGVPTMAEQRELEQFQRKVSGSIPVPLGALDVPDYP